MINYEETKEKVKDIFVKLYRQDTNWSIYADWFIEWNVENDFLTDSFDNFVDWLYQYYPDKLKDDALWDFFFGWGNLKEFVEGFVMENERKKFAKWVKNKHGVSI